VSTRYIDELRISGHAEDSLLSRGIDPDNVLEVLWNRPAFFRDKVRGRDLMIGPTDHSNTLITVVIEPTSTDGVWDVVTGWYSVEGEKTRWQNKYR
jgi:hypothetical protein